MPVYDLKDANKNSVALRRSGVVVDVFQIQEKRRATDIHFFRLRCEDNYFTRDKVRMDAPCLDRHGTEVVTCDRRRPTTRLVHPGPRICGAVARLQICAGNRRSRTVMRVAQLLRARMELPLPPLFFCEGKTTFITLYHPDPDSGLVNIHQILLYTRRYKRKRCLRTTGL
jgi:hypothetical protein